MGDVVTSRHIAALADERAHSAAGGVVRAAVFDADGTLWRGDIGDTAFAGAAARGLIDDATWRGPMRAFGAAWGMDLTDDKSAGIDAIVAAHASGALAAWAAAHGHSDAQWRLALYEMQAWIYAGASLSVVGDYGEALFAEGFEREIYEDMRALIATLKGRGIDVFIASASHVSLVVPGAARLGIDANHVLGMTPDVDARGRGLPRLRVSTYGPHKAAAVAARLGGPPLLAFGDSVLFTDKELLESALVPVAVATRGAHRAAALADPRMLLLDPAA